MPKRQPRTKRKFPPPQRTEWFILEDPSYQPDVRLHAYPRMGPRTDYKIQVFGSVVGPLRRRKDIMPGRVKNLFVIGAESDSAVFIGNTRVGKTRTAQSLASALGGSTSEEVNEEGRTLYETNVVFGLYTKKGKPTLYAVTLNTHPGHDLHKSKGQRDYLLTTKSITTGRDFCAAVLVLNPYENLEEQVEETIVPLMEEWWINRFIRDWKESGKTYHVSALFTRSDERLSQVDDSILARLRGLGVTNIYYADNNVDVANLEFCDRPASPRLHQVPTSSFEAVVDTIRTNNDAPDFRLIYFGGGDRQIPERLTDYVVHFKETPFQLRPAVEADQIYRRSADGRFNFTQTESYKW